MTRAPRAAVLSVLSVLSVLCCACFETKVALVDAGADRADAGLDEQAPHHARCDLPLTEDRFGLEFSAEVFLVEQGMPDAFLGIECATLAPLARCSPSEPCPFEGTCLMAVPGERGYCVRNGSETDHTQLGYRDGLCHEDNITHADKAALCCAKVPGLDCRSFPFTTRGGPGSFCAHTEDCEAGLACRQAFEEQVLGTCQCPEADSALQRDSMLCSHPSTPVWGAPSEPRTTGDCHTALDPAFVEEVLSSDWPPDHAIQTEPRPVQAPSGAPVLVHHMERPYFIGQPGDLPAVGALTKVQDLAFGYAAYDLGFDAYNFLAAYDPAGSLHVLVEGDAGLLGALGGADWSEEPLPARCVQPQGFWIDLAGQKHVLCAHPEEPDLAYHRETAEGWVSERAARWFSLLFASDSPTLQIAYGEPVRVVDAATGRTLREETASTLAATYAGGDLVLAMVVEGGTAIDVVTSSDLRAFSRERVWSHPLGAGMPLGISLGASREGEVAIAHRTPEGIALTRKEQGAWTTRVLTTDMGLPGLAFGAAGDVQVYYVVDTDWSQYVPFEELRRVREGVCP